MVGQKNYLTRSELWGYSGIWFRFVNQLYQFPKVLLQILLLK